MSVSGPIEVNSPLAARAAAVSGLGFAILPDFIAAPDIESGRLVTVLDDRILKGGGIFAVYPHRRYLPAKVRVFVDFLVQWFKAAAKARMRALRATSRSQFRPVSGNLSAPPKRWDMRPQNATSNGRDHAMASPCAAIFAAGRPGRRPPARLRRSPARRDAQPGPDSEIAAPSLALRRSVFQHGADGVRQELRPEARRQRARRMSPTPSISLARRVQLFPARHRRRQGRGDEAAAAADGQFRERPADHAVRIRAEGADQARRQDRFRRLRPDLLHGDRLHRGRPT